MEKSSVMTDTLNNFVYCYFASTLFSVWTYPSKLLESGKLIHNNIAIVNKNEDLLLFFS